MSPALPLLLQRPEYSPERKKMEGESTCMRIIKQIKRRRMVEKQEGRNPYVQSKVKGEHPIC